MGKPKEPKPQTDRLQEGISLLKQLKEAGIRENTLSYLQTKQAITEWVKTGEPYEGTIDYSEYGRFGYLQLPRYTNKAADIQLKIKPQ
jgi:hypothetical protein